MAVCPEWLARRQGALELSTDGHTWFVVFDQRPQYALEARPAQGRFSCHVKETISGRRIDSHGAYVNADEAIRGGLEDLRKALGW